MSDNVSTKNQPGSRKSEKSVNFSFRVNETLALQIEKFCAESGLSYSEFFREASQMKIVHDDLISMIRGKVFTAHEAHKSGVDF